MSQKIYLILFCLFSILLAWPEHEFKKREYKKKMKTENETTGEVKVIEKTRVFVQLIQGPYTFTQKTNRLHKANFYCSECLKFGGFY